MSGKERPKFGKTEDGIDHRMEGWILTNEGMDSLKRLISRLFALRAKDNE